MHLTMILWYPWASQIQCLVGALVCTALEIEKSTLFVWKGGECFQDAWKYMNVEFNCKGFFVTHCSLQNENWNSFDTLTASSDFSSSGQTAQPHCLLIYLKTSSNNLMTKFLSLGVIYLQLVTTDSEDETEAGHIRWSTRSEDNLLLSNIVGFNKDSMAYQDITKDQNKIWRSTVIRNWL